MEAVETAVRNLDVADQISVANVDVADEISWNMPEVAVYTRNVVVCDGCCVVTGTDEREESSSCVVAVV